MSSATAATTWLVSQGSNKGMFENTNVLYHYYGDT